MIALYVILAIVVILVLYFIIARNSLIGLDNNVEEAFSTMDVYLKKRWDLIPNLVETVKGYAEHEKSTLEEVVNLRNTSYDKMSMDEKIEANQKMSNELSKLMLLVENYPDLKANQNFIDLSQNLTKVEEDIANSRKYYNAVVKQYNNKVEMFPSSIVASMSGFKIKKMYLFLMSVFDWLCKYTPNILNPLCEVHNCPLKYRSLSTSISLF